MNESLLDLNLAETPDLENAVEGEHSITLSKMALHASKESGNISIATTVKVTDQANCYSMTSYSGLPTVADDTEKAATKRRGLKNLCRCFNISYDTLQNCLRDALNSPRSGNEDWGDSSFSMLIGSTGTAIVKHEEYQGIISTKIKTWVFDKD